MATDYKISCSPRHWGHSTMHRLFKFFIWKGEREWTLVAIGFKGMRHPFDHKICFDYFQLASDPVVGT